MLGKEDLATIVYSLFSFEPLVCQTQFKWPGKLNAVLDYTFEEKSDLVESHHGFTCVLAQLERWEDPAVP